MKLSSISALIIAAACIAGYPATSMGADSTLVLVMGGEAYDGPPKFEVSFGGKVLGEGAVAAAIDTATTGRFADVKDKTPFVQSFLFRIPEGLFSPTGTVEVTLTNEAYGGEGSGRDRNLYLASVAVNGRVVTASGLATMSGNGARANEMLGEFLVLPDNTARGISEPPDGGWPDPIAKIAAVAATAAAQVVPVSLDRLAPDPLTTASIPVVVEPTAEVPGMPVAEPMPVESTKTASLDPNPEAQGPGCGLDEIYNVVGFNENSNDLTPDLVARLDQIIEDIGIRQCNVTVTGYSSKQGSYATNALFAIERAQNSLRYMQERGLKYVRASATGVGATDQFGPDFRSNRRVVITVTP
ncbi:MAG: OmpA family protein [Devosia sp.]